MSALVLLADDDSAIRTVISRALGRAGFDVRATDNMATLWQWIKAGEGALVITDVIMPDENAFDFLPRIKKLRPDLPLIVISAQNSLATAIKAAEQGAYEYLPKPFDLNELTGVVARALEQTDAPLYKEGEADAEKDEEGLPLIGRSPAMQEIYRAVARLTLTDVSVLITGESGTGKELVARAMHDYGTRRKGRFVALNMAAIPKELVESELFGYEKGAFTGADTRAEGRFAQASGGTLFLDEIGDMPMEMQTRLLRVLQEGEYLPVGGQGAVQTDVRIIAATHRDLELLIKQGLFREDLYFRLNVVPLRIPPLRERREDIPDLVRHFLTRGQAEGLDEKHFAPDALDFLKQQIWRGNVRELENFVRRVSVLHAEERISGEIVRLAWAESHPNTQPIDTNETDLSAQVATHLARYFAEYGDDLPPYGLYGRILRDIEKPLLEQALEATKGNQIRAAELLGLNRNTLRKKLRELGISIARGAS